jgi:hypothetical protein
MANAGMCSKEHTDQWFLEIFVILVKRKQMLSNLPWVF